MANRKKPTAPPKPRSTDAEAAGVQRTQVVDGKHIGYGGDPDDVRHLSPRAKRMMGIKS